MCHADAPERQSRTRIALVGGFRNWAYDYKADALIRHLGHKYAFDKLFTDESLHVDHEAYDGVYVFYWLSTNLLNPIPREKLAGEVTSHRRLETFSDEEIRNVIDRFAVFTANSRLLLDQFRPLRDDVIYTPNGVDTDQFAPMDSDAARNDSRPFTVAWVGDPSTPEKHFQDIVLPLREKLPSRRFRFDALMTSRRIPGERRFKPANRASEMERACRPTGHILLQFQIDLSQDQYTATVVNDVSREVVPLFQASEVIHDRAIPKNFVAMNHELLLRRT